MEPRIWFGKIDATSNEGIADRAKINSYPTLRWYQNEKESEYDGGNTSDTIISWIDRQTGTPFLKVNCDMILQKIKATSRNVIYFGPTDNELFQSFAGVA